MHNSGGAIMVAEAPIAAPLVAASQQPAAPPLGPPSRPPSARAPTVIAGPIVDAPMPAPPRPTLASSVIVGPSVDTQMPPLPERLAPARIAAVAVGPSGRIFVQAGAFSMIDNAQRVQSRIAPLGSVRVMTASVNGIEVYRVRLGPVESVEQADRLLARVVGSGYREARIVTD